MGEGSEQAAESAATEGSGAGAPPPWVPATIRRSIVWAISAVLITLAALWFLGLERNLVGYLILAELLALSLEPGVIWLHEKRGLRRGSATALLLVSVLAIVVVFVVAIAGVIAQEADQIIGQLPTYIDQVNDFTQDHFDTTIISASQRADAANAAKKIQDYLTRHMDEVVGQVASLLSGIFTLFTVGLFTFYLTADGPEVRRALLSRLPPDRQRHALFAWETAIRKVGGYLYSRLLLALINGALLYLTLKIIGAPFALPLSLFAGVVSSFIPIVGTYVGGAVPVLVVLAENGTTAALIVVAEIVVYQQLENYFLSPRISAKTIELNPGVAFGAAMAGGAVGGFVGAFFALPIAATIQAFLSTYTKTYEVVDSSLTRIDHPPAKAPKAGQRRWGRRSEVEHSEAGPSPDAGNAPD